MQVADVEWQTPRWVDTLKKHRRCGPGAREKWERSDLVAETLSRGRHSLYSPYLSSDEIREMEMLCLQNGTQLPGSRHNVRTYWFRSPDLVGASSGEKTNYIFVQYNISGEVHGYPVTAAYLRQKGATP